MSYRITIRPAVEADLEEAATWYEVRRPGLGKEFLAGVDQTIEKLKRHPDFGILAHRTLRRASIARFPYGVFYQVIGELIVVVGVFHGRRAPRKWKSRME